MKNKTRIAIVFAALLISINLTYANVGIVFPYPNISANNLQEDPYLAFAEEMPTPEGGMGAIHKKVEYPALAKKAGIEGKVYLLVYVNESGNVDDVKILKSVPGGCDDAAVKAVKSIKYSPGKNGGVPVKVKLSMVIEFKIQK